MSPRKTLHLKTYLMIAIMTVAGPLGNVLLAQGMKHSGDPEIWPPAALLHTCPQGLRFGIDLAGCRLADHFFCGVYACAFLGGL
jgi:hypothetical protein